MENVQQDTISKCNHLDSDDVEACAMWVRVEGIGTILTMQEEGVQQNFVFLWWFTSCASMVVLERTSMFITTSFKVIWSQMYLWLIIRGGRKYGIDNAT